MKKNNFNIYNQIIYDLLTYLFIPLKNLDIFVKSIYPIKIIYKTILNYIVNNIENLVITNNYYYYIFVLGPRLCLMILLWFDIFYISKIEYFYKYIYIGLLILCNTYILYSINKEKEDLILEIKKELTDGKIDVLMELAFYNFAHEECKRDDPNYDEDDWNTILTYSSRITVDFSFFIEYQSKPLQAKINYEIYPKMLFNNTFTEKQKQEYKTTLKIQIENIIKFAKIKSFYDQTNHNDNSIKYIKLLIYINYLIIWLFILIVSLPSLSALDTFNTVLCILNGTLQVNEPFSNLQV